MMKEKLEACFRRLQELDIKPTVTNMERLLQCLYDLRDIYNELKGGADDGRAAADSE
jgi:hypothetical protein